MTAPTGNEGFLLAESAAVKNMFTDIYVSDRQVPDGKPVPVRFRYPEAADSELTYPHVIVSLLHVGFGQERAHSGGRCEIDYIPSTAPSVVEDFEEETAIIPDQPIPVDLTYQCELLSRDPRHDIQITGQVLGHGRVPFRGQGWVYVPEDETWRRVTNLNGVQPVPFYDKNGHQVYRSIITLMVNAELLPGRGAVYRRAKRIVLQEEFGEGNVRGLLNVY